MKEKRIKIKKRNLIEAEVEVEADLIQETDIRKRRIKIEDQKVEVEIEKNIKKILEVKVKILEKREMNLIIQKKEEK
jgi:hypothetical protein